MENIAINITANGTTTLDTLGKYCDRYIDINVNVPASGGGNLAHAILTHSTGATNLNYRTFDLTNYITSGTIYFMTHYGNNPRSTYAIVITNGAIVEAYYGSSGSAFKTSTKGLSAPTFELTNGILKISGSTSLLQSYADVIYTV